MTEHLGKGAFASVNKAIEIKTGKKVAIKSFDNFKIKQHRAQKVIINEA